MRVSRPSGSVERKPSIAADFTAARICSSEASGRANRIFSRMVPAKITGFWPIQLMQDEIWCGVRVFISASPRRTRPLSGLMKPRSISISVDFPAPDSPSRISVSPADSRKLIFWMAGPRVGSQVYDTCSALRATPAQFWWAGCALKDFFRVRASEQDHALLQLML